MSESARLDTKKKSSLLVQKLGRLIDETECWLKSPQRGYTTHDTTAGNSEECKPNRSSSKSKSSSCHGCKLKFDSNVSLQLFVHTT